MYVQVPLLSTLYLLLAKNVAVLAVLLVFESII